MAVAKYKPLSFTTTLRNPERIPAFLKCLAEFEGQTLTSDVIHEVVKSVIGKRLYKPTSVSRSPELSEIYNNEEVDFSVLQLEQIVIENKQHHKEAGFAAGWDSRFDTWYKIMKEFGFANYSMGRPIIITQTGHMLIDAYSEEPVNGRKIQKVYLNALMKYQTNNPLRKNLNENAPLPLLLNVIKKSHEDPENSNDAGLARAELPILICWTDNDAEAAYKYIKDIRSHVGFRASDEYIYEHCLSILQSDNRNYFKMDKICHEAVDEYIRKMRMSGLLSLRGNGRFFDINRFEEEAANYVIDNYSKYDKYETADEYIEYMGTIDSNILSTKEAATEEVSTVKQKKLAECSKQYSKETIFTELRNVCHHKESQDDVLKYIPGPTRLEFLTSIALVQNFDGLKVLPNYPVDDEGFPTSTASGGKADIECFDTDYDSYYEVTLMCGRADQVNNEIIPIGRHLLEVIDERRPESFAVFIAPAIHSDTISACEWQKYRNNIDIIPYNIEEFIQGVAKNERASSLLYKKSEK